MGFPFTGALKYSARAWCRSSFRVHTLRIAHM